MDAAYREKLIPLLKLVLTSGIGTKTYERLLRHFGSPEAILHAPPDRLTELHGIGPKLAEKITQARHNEAAVQHEFERAEALKVRFLAYDDEAFPRRLRETYDPPLVLWVRGAWQPEDQVSIAIVGTRRCSLYGQLTAERLAAGLAYLGITIISGGARGIDTAAHRGALSVEAGRTVAVFGNGVGKCYPSDNKELFERLLERGAVISEFPIDLDPRPEHFPRRNRLISGLSLGVVVVEGRVNSGALITAHHAREQGREVFAVPGKVDSALAKGPHKLIKMLGAKLVEDVDDIVDELAPVLGPMREAFRLPPEQQATTARSGESPTAPAALNHFERTLFEQIRHEPVHIDEIIAKTGLPAHQVSSTLMVLEIRRVVRALPGGLYVRK